MSKSLIPLCANNISFVYLPSQCFSLLNYLLPLCLLPVMHRVTWCWKFLFMLSSFMTSSCLHEDCHISKTRLQLDLQKKMKQKDFHYVITFQKLRKYSKRKFKTNKKGSSKSEIIFLYVGPTNLKDNGLIQQRGCKQSG